MIVEIEKLVFGGYGFGKDEKGNTYFLLNSLPQEKVEVLNTKKRKGVFFGIAERIIKESELRRQPKEDHFLSCSCFQILDDTFEDEIKKEIFIETFEKISGTPIEDLGVPLFCEKTNRFYGYRNKMEFSFIGKDLAFFKRESHEKVKINGCVLAKEIINESAREIIGLLPDKKIYKSLILKTDSNDRVIAGLFVTDPDFNFNLEKINFKKLNGFFIYYSPKNSPASLPQKLINSVGLDIFEEKLAGKTFFHSLLSFFQVNLEVFEKTINDIKKYVCNDKVVEFYSGVGTIGISLSDVAKEITMVESQHEATELAFRNILVNNVSNVKVLNKKSEDSLDLISKEKVVIFDPPRSGLHKKIIKEIIKKLPKRIIYLSCNPSTQARDFSLLKGYYKVKFLKIYNFFPKTYHLESLLVLDSI